MANPFFMTPRTRRLSQDRREMEALHGDSSILEFRADGDAPDHYEIVFLGAGLGPDGERLDRHEIEISLPSAYPVMMPEIRWKSPIDHPNIQAGRPCLGTFQMNPSVKLVDVVEILWDMARMAMFNVYGAYHSELSRWRELARAGAFPLDHRILRDRLPPAPKADGSEPDMLILGARKARTSPQRRGGTLGAGLMIYRPWDGKILLTRRSGTKERQSPGWWDSAGGGVEEGEDLLSAATREAREELGPLPELQIDPEPVWWAPNPFFAFALFLATLAPSARGWEPVLNEEHDDSGWFAPGDLPRPTLPGVRNAVRYFFRS